MLAAIQRRTAGSFNGWIPWTPLALLLILALPATASQPRWIGMWAVCAALYSGCKWLTFWPQRKQSGRAAALVYLFCWPGMDAREFLHGIRPPESTAIEWLLAAAKTAAGAAMTWRGVRLAASFNALAAGWIGMAGLILLLHCGIFHILALTWRAAGFSAQPIMRSPLLAQSLAEFWGARWNLAFSDLAREFIFRPLHARFGNRSALLIAFAVSGVVHELVISLPAGAGFGLPTAYFVMQGVGQLAERSALGARFGLRRGWRGWLFTLVVAAGPAFWLFHPAFVLNVFDPFLCAIGAM